MAQDVIIDFQVDYSSLDSAIDTLEKIGAVDKSIASAFKTTNAEINKQSTALKNTATALKTPIQSLDQLDKRTKSFVKNFVEGFNEGVNDALKEAGVSVKEFTTALEQGGVKGEKSTVSLRQELKNLTQEIAAAKASGGPVSPEMLQRAGQLKDAIKDANIEISNAGSDTRHLDNVVGSVSALAGAFSAAQGAAALFGDDSEDLQKALLRVNAAMAIATGLQQFFNAIQKEGSLVKLADVIATKAQIAVQTIYTAVTGKATAATVAFKVALAATGIGLLVIGVLALVNALNDSEDAINRNIDALKRLDEAEREGALDFIDVEERLAISRAKAAGKTEQDIFNIQVFWQNERIKNLKRTNASAQEIRAAEVDLEVLKNERIADVNKSARDKESGAARAAREKALQEAREARAREFDDFLASKQRELLASKEGSEERLKIEQDILKVALQMSLENEKLTIEQRKLLIEKFYADRLELERQFGRDREELILNNIQSDLNTELQNLNVSNERKLELQESSIRIASELEILAAQGNAAKIEEIRAKSEKAIRDLKLANLNEVTEREIQLADASNGAKKRALDRVAGDEKKAADVRINAINQALDLELDAIQRRIDANQEALEKNIISQEEYNLKSAQLNDQYNQAWENAEQKKADITQKANEKIKEENRKLIEDTINTLADTLSVLSALFDSQSITENNRIAAQKRQLDELREAGAITEKEAISRQKRIEAEERKARQRQAQRDKTIAVFNAILAIPSAILQGLRQGGPVLAAIYGALAAAQAAIVISRPVPKFATGKKGSYSGLGMVGEAGTEMIERNGQLFVTTKPTITYLGPKDKVFTASETKRMMPSVKKDLMNRAEGIDYKKLSSMMAQQLAEIMKSNNPTHNIYVDGIAAYSEEKNLKVTYLDRYYSSKIK